MLLKSKPVICLVLTLLLSACQPEQPSQTQTELQTAHRQGNLPKQLDILTQLLHRSQQTQNQASKQKGSDDKQGDKIAQYQQQIKEIQQAQQLNIQASQQLKNGKPFEALEHAVKADTLIYNIDSRQMIKSVLTEYYDFLAVYPKMLEWAVTPLEKLVVPGSIPVSLHRYQQAMNLPRMWPDNALMTFMQSKNYQPRQMLASVSQEQEQLAELVRLLTRIINKQPNNAIAQAIIKDAKAINAMYNTVLSDANEFYLRQGIEGMIAGNKELAGIGRDAQIDQISREQWLIDYRLTANIYRDKLHFCCNPFSQQMAQLFPYLEQATPYHNAVLALNKQYAELVKTNFVASQNAEQSIAFASSQNTLLTERLAPINQQVDSVDRVALVKRYLQVTTDWHQGSFHQLETLIPLLRKYKSTIRGY